MCSIPDGVGMVQLHQATGPSQLHKPTPLLMKLTSHFTEKSTGPEWRSLRRNGVPVEGSTEPVEPVATVEGTP